MSFIEMRLTGRIIQCKRQKDKCSYESLGHSGRQPSRQFYGRNVAGSVDREVISVLNVSENVFQINSLRRLIKVNLGG